MNKQAIINSSFYTILCFISKLISLKTKKINGGGLSIAHNALFRKSRLFVNGKDSKISVGRMCRFRNLVIEIKGDNSIVEVMDNVMVYERCYISIKGDNCHCIIGNKTTIGGASLFLEESNTNIEIGEDCMLGRSICVQTTDFHSILDANTGERINRPESVKIGNHVWLGYGVTMSKGSEIADDSVVGEHSLVTKKITQPNICVVGTPSKIIKENINWDRKKL